MMAAHEAFYSDLFSRENLDSTSQQDLFSYVNLHLSEPEQASCEDPLTLAEASEELQCSNRIKSPGADGLTDGLCV